MTATAVLDRSQKFKNSGIKKHIFFFPASVSKLRNAVQNTRREAKKIKKLKIQY
jgi:hypothetical protein